VSYTLRLVNENVLFFTIDNRRFIRLTSDSTGNKPLQNGYYQDLINGNIQILVKRTKLFNERLEQGNKNIEFYSKDKFFLQKNNMYYIIDTKSSILKHMIDHEKEMQNFIKTNKLKFNKASREIDIIKITEYYNSLSRS
jgi:hypothetical protein